MKTPNLQRNYWPYHEICICSDITSNNLFNDLLLYVRFDNENIRPQRDQKSKSAAIDYIWITLSANFISSSTPSTNLTVDEQLCPFREQTRFTQYLPTKPSEYGIKLKWICDSMTNYPLKSIIYTG